MKIPAGVILHFKSVKKGTEMVVDEEELVTCKDCYYKDTEYCKWRKDETPDDDDYCSIATIK